MPSEPLTFALAMTGAQAVGTRLAQMTAGLGALRGAALGALGAITPLQGVLMEVGRVAEVSARLGDPRR